MISADVTCRVMSIAGSAVTSATTVRGFTFTGGDASTEGAPRYGGGLDISGGVDPVIERCRVTGNLAGHNGIGYGGGISVRGAGTAAEIRYCRIDNNLASNAGTSSIEMSHFD